MRYFIDTEFAERPNTIELISLGIVADNGRELYIEISDFDESLCNPWVRQNVLPHLWSRQKDKNDFNKWSLAGGIGGLMPKREAASEVRKFIGDDKPTFWGYYSDYDWTVFCWLFGSMVDLPAGWPQLCLDLRQRQLHLNIPRLPMQNGVQHNALADARWVREAAHWLDWQELITKNAQAAASASSIPKIEFWPIMLPEVSDTRVSNAKPGAIMRMRRSTDGRVVSSIKEMEAAGGGEFQNWYGPAYDCPVCHQKWVVDSIETPACRNTACASNGNS